MKLFLACFSLITLATNCNSKKTALNNENTSQQTDVTISYSAQTRGFFQEFMFKLAACVI